MPLQCPWAQSALAKGRFFAEGLGAIAMALPRNRS